MAKLAEKGEETQQIIKDGHKSQREEEEEEEDIHRMKACGVYIYILCQENATYKKNKILSIEQLDTPILWWEHTDCRIHRISQIHACQDRMQNPPQLAVYRTGLGAIIIKSNACEFLRDSRKTRAGQDHDTDCNYCGCMCQHPYHMNTDNSARGALQGTDTRPDHGTYIYVTGKVTQGRVRVQTYVCQKITYANVTWMQVWRNHIKVRNSQTK